MNSINYKKLFFDVEANTTTSSDLDPVVSFDHVNRLNKNISTLMSVLGRTALTPMSSGTQIERYKTTVTKGGEQPAEGDIIPLSKVERKPLPFLSLKLNKYRKLTTADAIQKVGSAIALNDTDDALVSEIQKDVKKRFFDMLTASGATAATAGANLQATAANVWAKLITYYDDTDATPVFFVNPADVATYLGNAQITVQNAFGFSYVESFLAMGNAIISPAIPAGKVYATASENLNGAYVPQGGDVASAFSLTYDESGMVGMTHSLATDRASVETLIMSGVLFYTEDAAGVIVGEITPASVG